VYTDRHLILIIIILILIIIRRLWKVEARVIAIVIGTLETIPRGLEENLRIAIKVELIQKVALIGTA